EEAAPVAATEAHVGPVAQRENGSAVQLQGELVEDVEVFQRESGQSRAKQDDRPLAELLHEAHRPAGFVRSEDLVERAAVALQEGDGNPGIRQRADNAFGERLRVALNLLDAQRVLENRTRCAVAVRLRDAARQE